MNLACQINTYKGDGSPLETEYKFCLLEINTENKDKCSIIFRNQDYNWAEPIYFTLSKFRMFDTGMSLSGVNNANYGRLDLVLGTYGSAVYDLACIEQEYHRLISVYTNTRKYFKDIYFSNIEIEDITDDLIRQLARINFDSNQTDFRIKNI